MNRILSFARKYWAHELCIWVGIVIGVGLTMAPAVVIQVLIVLAGLACFTVLGSLLILTTSLRRVDGGTNVEDHEEE